MAKGKKLTEKHRPKTLDDVIGHPFIKNLKVKAKESSPAHMLFFGPAGTGKTTTAIAFAKERYGTDYDNFFTELNASDDRGINTIRDKIKPLLTRGSLFKKDHIVFLTEADSLTGDAQEALRRIMEKSEKIIFILDCNKVDALHSAIRSRCSLYHFRGLLPENILEILLGILSKEGVEPGVIVDNRELLTTISENSSGDVRAAINSLHSIYDMDKKTLVGENLQSEGTINYRGVVEFAMAGDVDRAKELLEKSIVHTKFNYKIIIKEFYKSVHKVEDRAIRSRLYIDLRDTAVACEQTRLFEACLMGFVSYCHIAPHLLKLPAILGKKI